MFFLKVDLEPLTTGALSTKAVMLYSYLKGLRRLSEQNDIKDKNKGYTLDFFLDSEDASTFLYMILKHLNKRVFLTDKKNKNIVYIRNSEDILDVIYIIGGEKVFFEYENITILKEIKSEAASIKQLDMIEYIDEKIGLDSLTEALREIAILRQKNESDSFQELAEKLKISKSGVRNRFRRLEEIYNEIKGGS